MSVPAHQGSRRLFNGIIAGLGWLSKLPRASRQRRAASRTPFHTERPPPRLREASPLERSKADRSACRQRRQERSCPQQHLAAATAAGAGTGAPPQRSERQSSPCRPRPAPNRCRRASSKASSRWGCRSSLLLHRRVAAPLLTFVTGSKRGDNWGFAPACVMKRAPHLSVSLLPTARRRRMAPIRSRSRYAGCTNRCRHTVPEF